MHYHQRVTDLVAPMDPLIIPSFLEEAVMNAVLVRAHNRVHEVSLAQLAEVQLQETFDEMRMDEDFEMAEEQERVERDNTWL